MQITAPQNNDVTIGLTVFEADDATPQDCTGLTPVMYVKASQNSDDTRAVTLTLGTGLFWVEQNGGLLSAVLSHVLLPTAASTSGATGSAGGVFPADSGSGTGAGMSFLRSLAPLYDRSAVISLTVSGF